MRQALCAVSGLALALSACATNIRVPEVPLLDNRDFTAAKREPEPKQPVQIVEVPKPLPLPGQLKPIPSKRTERAKDETGAPDFRIFAGSTEIGAAWRKTKQGSEATYLRVKLDDPALPQPIWGALLEATEDGVVRLVWSRDRQG